ncbi:hypothetical protein E3O85_RS10715 [Enterococcus hirae]
MTDNIPKEIKLYVTEIEFTNTTLNQKLWTEKINPLIKQIRDQDTLETIREDSNIIATKKLYKTLGKDPARFRPSSDSLWRRAVKGNDLYQVNTLVDLNNYLSLKYHLPFGSYDLKHIQEPIILSKGVENEEYAGIGKKMINLENLLLLSDTKGAFGSPTSDSTRAMISEQTTHAIVVAYLFDTDPKIIEEMQRENQQTILAYLKNATIIQQMLVDHNH